MDAVPAVPTDVLSTTSAAGGLPYGGCYVGRPPRPENGFLDNSGQRGHRLFGDRVYLERQGRSEKSEGRSDGQGKRARREHEHECEHEHESEHERQNCRSQLACRMCVNPPSSVSRTPCRSPCTPRLRGERDSSAERIGTPGSGWREPGCDARTRDGSRTGRACAAGARRPGFDLPRWFLL